MIAARPLPDPVTLTRAGDHWRAEFRAMASPCEVLVRTPARDRAYDIASAVAGEAWRVENKFSRYLAGNVVDRINSSNGADVEVDEETAALLDFAHRLHVMSEGRFDITSGALREAWTFDGSDRLPTPAAVRKALSRVGWSRLHWNPPVIRLAEGMQIDFGGIGKEYAVDRAASLIEGEAKAGCLINFGGDLMAVGDGPAWRVGVETPDDDTGEPARVIRLVRGGLATSGDSRRYLLKDGVRYGHVLDCRSGWPVTAAPRSVTVAAASCTQAGMLATLAIICGADAEAFLDRQGVDYWCLR